MSLTVGVLLCAGSHFVFHRLLGQECHTAGVLPDRSENADEIFPRSITLGLDSYDLVPIDETLSVQAFRKPLFKLHHALRDRFTLRIADDEPMMRV